MLYNDKNRHISQRNNVWLLVQLIESRCSSRPHFLLLERRRLQPLPEGYKIWEKLAACSGVSHELVLIPKLCGALKTDIILASEEDSLQRLS